MHRLIRLRQGHPTSSRRWPFRRRVTAPIGIVGGVVAAVSGAAFLLWPGNARAADTVAVATADPRAASSTWFVSADGHYRRSSSDVHPHHTGDLPSVWVNRNGTGSTEFVIDRIQPGELFNRAVVVHVGADNFGNVPVGDALNQYVPNSPDATTATRNTGNAGDRLACGTVEITR